ncbi:hypothetical protein ACRRTK_001572 [Alexandromys fortis]
MELRGPTPESPPSENKPNPGRLTPSRWLSTQSTCLSSKWLLPFLLWPFPGNHVFCGDHGPHLEEDAARMHHPKSTEQQAAKNITLTLWRPPG